VHQVGKKDYHLTNMHTGPHFVLKHFSFNFTIRLA